MTNRDVTLSYDDLHNAQAFLKDKKKSSGSFDYTRLGRIVDFAQKVLNENWQPATSRPGGAQPVTLPRYAPYNTSGSHGGSNTATRTGGYTSSSTGNRREQRRGELTRIITELDELENTVVEKTGDVERWHTLYMEVTQKFGVQAEQKKHLEEQLQTVSSDLTRTQIEKSDLAKTIGKEMSRDTDDTRTERISGACRPSNISAEYERLSMQQASAVKTSLKIPVIFPKDAWDMFKNNLICNIFQESWNEMKIAYDKLMQHFMESLQQPIDGLLGNSEASQKSGLQTKKAITMPPDMMKVIHEFLLTNVKGVNVDAEIENVIEKALNIVAEHLYYSEQITNPDKLGSACAEVRESDKLRNFVRSVCHLAWQMVIQNPMMLLKTDGIAEPHNDETQNAVMKAGMRFGGNMVVRYYIEPTLIHAKRVLVKGRVELCAAPKQNVQGRQTQYPTGSNTRTSTKPTTAVSHPPMDTDEQNTGRANSEDEWVLCPQSGTASSPSTTSTSDSPGNITYSPGTTVTSTSAYTAGRMQTSPTSTTSSSSGVQTTSTHAGGTGLNIKRRSQHM